MNIEQNQVRELMLRMGQECPDNPVMPSEEVRVQRIRFIAEELCELSEALGMRLEIGGLRRHAILVYAEDDLEPDLVAAYDANLDIEVMSIGTAVAMGYHLQPGWDEVHRSNNTKTPNGKGKFTKGENYSPPNLQRVLQQQIYKSEARVLRSQADDLMDKAEAIEKSAQELK